MPTKKKPSAAQLAARAKFVKMVRAKAAAKKAANKKAAVGKYKKGKTTFIEVGEKAPKRGKAVRVVRRKTSGKPGTFRDFVKIGSVTIKPRPTILALSRKIAKLTNWNDHNKAVLVLAEFLKSKEYKAVMKSLIIAHKEHGSMPSHYISLRNEVLKRLLEILKNKHGQLDYETVKRSF